MSPTQRSLEKWRKLGYTVKVVERWNPYAHIRQDLWGFDLLALREDSIIGIQTTTNPHTSERVAKLLALPTTGIWLASPTRRALVEGWAKRGPQGKRKRWESTEIWL